MDNIVPVYIKQIVDKIEELIPDHEKLPEIRKIVTTKNLLCLEKVKTEQYLQLFDKFNNEYKDYIKKYNKEIEAKVYKRFKEEYFQNFHLKITKALENIQPDIYFSYDPYEDEY